MYLEQVRYQRHILKALSRTKVLSHLGHGVSKKTEHTVGGYVAVGQGDDARTGKKKNLMRTESNA